jgi:hypothetical protein
MIISAGRGKSQVTEVRRSRDIHFKAYYSWGDGSICLKAEDKEAAKLEVARK